MKLRFARFVATTGLIVLLASFGTGPAEAKQPIGVSSLVGTWENIKADGGIIEVVITEVNGSLEVHPYGSCSPTPCDWGIHPALRFSKGISSSAAIGLQLTINTSFATRYMQGHIITNALGQKFLEITTQTKFILRGDLRNDYELVEDFKLK